MKEDGIGIEEVCRLCREDPQYSLGVKLQKYMIRSTTDIRHIRMHKRELMDSLSDEELQIYNDEVKDLSMKKLVWDEFKRRGLLGKKKAKERSSFPLGDGDGDIHIVPRLQIHGFKPRLLDRNTKTVSEPFDLRRESQFCPHDHSPPESSSSWSKTSPRRISRARREIQSQFSGEERSLGSHASTTSSMKSFLTAAIGSSEGPMSLRH